MAASAARATDHGGSTYTARPRPSTAAAASTAQASRPRMAAVAGTSGAAIARTVGSSAKRDREHEHRDAEEHPAPPEVLRDRAGRGRADQRRQHPGGREAPEHARVQHGRVEARHDHVERDRHRAPAEPLHQPAGHQDPHRRREAGHDQPRREQRDRQRQGSSRAVPVAPPTRDDHADHARGQRTGERERVQRGAVEGAGHRGHHGGDRERLERDQEDQHAHRPGRGAQAPPLELRVDAHDTLRSRNPFAVAVRSTVTGSWSASQRCSESAPRFLATTS